MYQPQRRRNPTVLCVMLGLAALYAAVLLARHRVVGSPRLDGTIGVILGLYICSHPAANMLDIILFGRHRGPYMSRQAQAWWLGFNVVVLVAGCLVLVMGTTRFAGGAF